MYNSVSEGHVPVPLTNLRIEYTDRKPFGEIELKIWEREEVKNHSLFSLATLTNTGRTIQSRENRRCKVTALPLYTQHYF